MRGNRSRKKKRKRKRGRGGRKKEMQREEKKELEGGGGGSDRGRLFYLQEEDVLGEPLDWFEEEALQTEAGLALVVLSSKKRNKFWLLFD